MISVTCFAQTSDSLNLSYGISIGYLKSYHETNFISIPGYENCCVPFGNSMGNGFSSELFVEKSLLSYLVLNLGVNFSWLSTTLLATEFIGYSDYKSQPIELYSTHSLKATIGLLSFNPKLYVEPLKSYPLKLGIGGQIGTIFPKNFNQVETLSSDAVSKGFTFYNGTNSTGSTRNKINAKLPVRALVGFLSLSIKYDFSLSEGLQVSPEINYNYCLQKIIKSIDWKINSLSLGLSIAYHPVKNVKIIPKKEVIKHPIKSEIAVNNQKPVTEEKKKTDTIVSTYATKVQLKTPDTSFVEIVKIDSSECYYCIYISTIDKNKAESCLQKLKNSAESDIFIENWYNDDNNKNYFRIRTKCYQTVAEAMNQAFVNKERILKVEPNAQFYIKCLK